MILGTMNLDLLKMGGTGGLGHDVENYDSYAFLQFSIFLDSETCVVPGF